MPTIHTRELSLAILLAVVSGQALAQSADPSKPGALPPPNPVVLDNPYATVTRDAAPCAQASASCEDRVIVAMSDIELAAGSSRRKMRRGDLAIFKAGESYRPPAEGSYYEVALKPRHPPVKSPPELIPPPKNTMVHENERFFIYEEQLAAGDTRTRHSHSQRVEIRVNQGPQLQQWVWRGAEIAQVEPGVVNWREPVIHVVKNVGDMPLRNIIIEFRPEQPDGMPAR